MYGINEAGNCVGNYWTGDGWGDAPCVDAEMAASGGSMNGVDVDAALSALGFEGVDAFNEWRGSASSVEEWAALECLLSVLLSLYGEK